MPNLAKSLADSSEATQVVGPASATDNAVARWDGATGKLLQNSLVTIADNGDIALPASRTVDGRDVSADGATLDGHTTSIAANTAAIATKADAAYTIRAHTGTSDTFVLADAGKLVTSNNAAAVTQTIPANASVAFPVGTIITLCQLGAGQVTVVITSDTLRNPGLTAKLRAQYSMATLTKIAATEWVLSGDLSVT